MINIIINKDLLFHLVAPWKEEKGKKIGRKREEKKKRGERKGLAKVFIFDFKVSIKIMLFWE